MFYDIDQAISSCEENPELVFVAIKNNYRDVYKKVLEKEDFNFNLVDENGNNVLMRLVKNKEFDLVNKYILNKDFLINYQNHDGNTIMHLLVTNNFVDIKEIIEKVLKRDDFFPNIKNNDGESILDKAILSNYIYTVVKILSDKRFNNIGLYSFKNLYETYIKSNNYGTYSKLNNYMVIFDNLRKKRLMPSMMKLIKILKIKERAIITDLEASRLDNLDTIINYVIKEAI